MDWILSGNQRKDKLSTSNKFHNILRLFDVSSNFPFTTSETMGDCYLLTLYSRVASRVAEPLALWPLGGPPCQHTKKKHFRPLGAMPTQEQKRLSTPGNQETSGKCLNPINPMHNNGEPETPFKAIEENLKKSCLKVVVRR